MSDDQREAGRIPRTIECELVHDLVDSCVPGDTVTITGVVKVSNAEEGVVWLSSIWLSLSSLSAFIFSLLKIFLNFQQFKELFDSYIGDTLTLK